MDIYCVQCGERMPKESVYCPSCGKERVLSVNLGSGSFKNQIASSSSTPADKAVALLVFGLFLAVGAGALYMLASGTGPLARAVPGAPTAASPPASATAPRNPGSPGGAPPSALSNRHPNIELPEQVVEFLDQLTAEAEAAPDDVVAWQKLGRARYRAAMLNRSYYDSAVAALDHVLDIDPENKEARRTRANIAYDTGRYPEAEKRFRSYLEMDPGDPAVTTDLASSILFQGRTEEAKALYREVIGKNPDFAQAHVNLGIALHADGDKENAVASLEKALELTDNPEQKTRIQQVIATAKGEAPPAMANPHASMGGAASNASSEYQKKVDDLFLNHRIVGPKVRNINWKSVSTAAVKIADFPMDKMPPVMRNKFKSGMNEAMSTLAREHGIETNIHVELVDAANDEVMDTFDGKEFVGAFDQENYR